MTDLEKKAIAEVKQTWLKTTDAARDEIEKLLVGERGFIRNNAHWLLVANGVACALIGYLAGCITG